MRSKNSIIAAAAGSGKTSRIVREALAFAPNRVAIVTYTDNNQSEIRKRLISVHGSMPGHVDVVTWYTFILTEMVRPYQAFLFDEDRITGVQLVSRRSAPYVRKADVRRFYLSPKCELYSDKLSLFVLECNELSSGKVMRRLQQRYAHIFIDEVQDLAAYDLDVLELWFRSSIGVTIVGDVRQTTYSTNPGSKHKKYRGAGLLLKFEKWRSSGLCMLETMETCYRCNQAICDFADLLFPAFPRTLSMKRVVTGHDGVFLLRRGDIDEYIARTDAVVLRWDKRTNIPGHTCRNFGEVKGLQFDRVVVIPTQPFQRFLRSGDGAHIEGSATKLYVAITRARYSVAIVYEGATVIDGLRVVDMTALLPRLRPTWSFPHVEL